MTDRRTGRARVAGMFLVAGMVTTGTLVGAGTASAATVAAGCNGTGAGHIGDQIALDGNSAAPRVRAGADKAKKDGFLRVAVNPDRLANTVREQGKIYVGRTVDPARSTSVSASAVASAVTMLLRQHDDGLGVVDSTRKAVLHAIGEEFRGCTVKMTAVNYQVNPAPTSPPRQPAPTGAAPPAAPQPRHVTVPAPRYTQPRQQPRTGGGFRTNSAGSLPLGTNVPQGRQAPRNYGNVPYVQPGRFAPSPQQRYGQGVPGYAPESGQVPGTPGKQQARDNDDPVRTAGQAQAMDGRRTGADIGLPMLLAVILLAGVSAALVRTWVLRRAPSA